MMPLREEPVVAPEPEEAEQESGLIRWLHGLALDLRSVALFRIAIGLCLIVDIVTRIPDIDNFYTDAGVLPREVMTRVGNPYAISLHMLGGSYGFELALFLLALVAAVGLLLGYQTRLMTVVSYILLASVHARNSMVVHGGDRLLTLLLFWSMFVPLNAHFSLDRALNRSAPPLPRTLLSAGTLAILLQMCALYWFSASAKMHPVWVTEQSAVYYALSLDMMVTPLGKSLLAYPDLLRWLTTSTLLLEAFGPLLLFSPVRTGPLRLAAVVIFVSFHAGLGLTMRLGLFAVICMAGWLALLPGEFWDLLGRARARLGMAGRSAPAFLTRVLQRWPPRLVPPPPREQRGLVGEIVVLISLALVSFNLILEPTDPMLKTGPLRAYLSATRLFQQWRMFAPYPSNGDGWYLAEGVNADGTRTVVWPASVGESKPADFRAAYPNAHWLDYLQRLNSVPEAEYRIALARYACRQWNRRHGPGERVGTVHLNYMLERTPPPGSPPPVIRKVHVLEQSCG